MCGIAGYIGSREISAESIRDCLGLMHRRGPDNSAFRHWRNGAGKNIYLLHSRLSIIDLDPRANQPFNAGTKWVALNGELYNYVELREELEARGCSFTTTSDTEVMVRALDRDGWKALDRCEGMWAFAVYDEADGSLGLCRDRFGEKPMYLFRDETGLYFGSEVKFIRAMLGRSLEVNFEHLYRYMVYGYRSLYKSGDTFFKNLRELPPATLLTLRPEGWKEETYWKPHYAPDEGMSYEEAVAGVRERLIRTVELRLRSDVPLAFCMSGGVDSNSLIAIAKRIFGYDVHGFTIYNTDERYDEREIVEQSVAEMGIRHTAVPVTTEDFLNRLRELVRYHDAPVYTISYYAHWLLMQQIAREGYRVAVSGTAGDEIFAGYYDHHLMYLYEVRDDPELLARSLEAWNRYVRPVVRNPYLQDPERFMRDPGFRDHLYLNSAEFEGYLKVGWKEGWREEHFTDSLLRNRMMNELFYEAVRVILHEDDLNSMYFSIENRSPLLDRDLYEFCNRIPTRYLISDGMAKAILRDAMRGIVPDRVLDERRKVGFNAPIFSFLDVKDPRVREEVLGPSPIFQHVRREMIERLLDKPYLENHESLFLFYFLNAKIFLELQYEDQPRAG
ncbi:MAG: asparagine synthase (glutamine-hydrolyzing) [Methanomicrobiales archaeon]|nr:asparagine synthase (glutamine-hydrolyzing) [Methanomicrobiales archaeon]